MVLNLFKAAMKESDSGADSGILTSVKKRKQPRRAEMIVSSLPGGMISELGSLMKESRGFRRSFSPRRSRHYRPSIRIGGLFEESSNGYLSSLLEI